MSNIFTLIFLQPLLNLLIWLYSVLPGHDIGWSIVLLTLIVKLILYPLTLTQLRQQRAMQLLQPKIEEIRSRLKDKKEEQASELMALYAREKFNPASSCLPLLIQLPIFIALYQAMNIGLTDQGSALLYSFVPHPTKVNEMFLGVFPLAKPSYILAVLASAVQFFQTKQLMQPLKATTGQPPAEVAGTPEAKDESMAAIMNKQMLYVMPVVTLMIGFKLPGGLTLYWFAMSVFTWLQQMWLLKKRDVTNDTKLISSS